MSTAIHKKHVASGSTLGHADTKRTSVVSQAFANQHKTGRSGHLQDIPATRYHLIRIYDEKKFLSDRSALDQDCCTTMTVLNDHDLAVVKETLMAALNEAPQLNATIDGHRLRSF